jgi:hypothetical protein
MQIEYDTTTPAAFEIKDVRLEARHEHERHLRVYLSPVPQSRNRFEGTSYETRKRSAILSIEALRGKKWVKARASCQFNLGKSRIFEVFTGLETCHVLRHEKAA